MIGPRGPRSVRLEVLPLAVCLLLLAGCASGRPQGVTIGGTPPVPTASGPERRAASPDRPRLAMLDVGEGDAILLTDGDHALLVDAGPDPTALREALARVGVAKLDGVVLTHPHPDHTGGIQGLSEAVPYSKLYVGAGFREPGVASTLAHIERTASVQATELAAGAKLDVGRLRLSVLWPTKGASLTDPNGASLVALVTASGATALLAGDAEAPVLETLIDEGRLGDVDVLKVGHHADEGALSERVVKTLSPSYALVSVGDNPYGYPSPSTLGLLAAQGIETLRSDEAGDVSIRFDPAGPLLED